MRATNTDHQLAPPWWTPVRTEQVRQLQERISLSARYYLMASLTLRTLFLLIYLGQIDPSQDPWLVFPAFTLLVLAVALTVVLRSQGSLWPQRAMLYSELTIFLCWTLYDITQGADWIVAHAQLALLPLLVASVPMRPATFPALGLGYSLILAAENLSVEGLPLSEALSPSAASLIAGVLGGVVAQIQRHMMASMDRQQQQYMSRARLFSLGQQTQLMLGPLVTPLQNARRWLRRAHQQQAPLPGQLGLWQRDPLQGHQDIQPVEQSLLRSREQLDQFAERLTTLQHQTQGLHQRTSSRFLLREPLEEAHHARFQAHGVALEVHAPQDPIELEGDRQKLEQLFGVLLELLHEHSLRHGPPPRWEATLEQLSQEQARVTLELLSRAPLDPRSHLGFLAQDLARGAFEGELQLHHDGQRSWLTLQLALRVESTEGQQFVPGFKSSTEAEHGVHAR